MQAVTNNFHQLELPQRHKSVNQVESAPVITHFSLKRSPGSGHSSLCHIHEKSLKLPSSLLCLLPILYMEPRTDIIDIHRGVFVCEMSVVT